MITPQLRNNSPFFFALAVIIMLNPGISLHADSILFEDDFKSGNCDNWEVVDYATFEVIDEEFCLMTSCVP